MKEIKVGITFGIKEQVTEKHSAAQVGSGALDVYSTPSMIALMEKTSMLCIASFLDENETTVGGMVNIRHHKPTAIGKKVRCISEVILRKDRRIDFRVEVYEGQNLVGDGQHSRFIVDKGSFLENV